MELRGKKLGMLVAARPDHPNFRHAVQIAEAALNGGVSVYLYCIDEAVEGLDDPALQRLRARGASLYACAYGAHRRKLTLDERALFSGLATVHDLITSTDRFLCFN